MSERPTITFPEAIRLTSGPLSQSYSQLKKADVLYKDGSRYGTSAYATQQNDPQDLDLDGRRENLIFLGSSVVGCVGYFDDTKWKGVRKRLRSGDFDISDYPRDVNIYLPTIKDNKNDERVKEIRYGDIDKDGDIDIAVELENSAIYVFCNILHTAPTNRQPIPQVQTTNGGCASSPGRRP